MVLGHLSLMRFWCLFVSKKIPNSAVMAGSSIVLIVLVGRRRTSTMSTIKLSAITALFEIFLETNKHLNLMKLKVFLILCIPLLPVICPGPSFFLDWLDLSSQVLLLTNLFKRTAKTRWSMLQWPTGGQIGPAIDHWENFSKSLRKSQNVCKKVKRELVHWRTQVSNSQRRA